MTLPAPPLLFITDRSLSSRPLGGIVAAVLAGGCRWVMLREKAMDRAHRLSILLELLPLCRGAGATLLVNGDIEAARQCDGVHLPAGSDVAAARDSLGAQAMIGISTHSLRELESATADGADYATLSPVFLTESKPGYGPALTPEGFAEIAGTAGLPVLALGGVTADTAGRCRSAGAAGIAVMGTLMRAPDPAATAATIISRWYAT